MAIASCGMENLVSTSSRENNTDACYNNTNVPLTNSIQHRKHRFTIFIGYGEEAGYVLKRCEQLKCKLGLGTNIQFLTYLLKFFEDRNTEFQDENAVKETVVSTNPTETVPSYVYNVKFKSFHPSQPVVETPSSDQKDANNRNVNTVSTSVPVSPHCIVEQENSPVFHQVQVPAKSIFNEQQNNQVEQMQLPAISGSEHSSELQQPVSFNNSINFETNVFTSVTPAMQITNQNQNIDKHEQSQSVFSSNASNVTEETATESDIQNEGVASLVKTNEIIPSLTLSSQNFKALKVIHQYMENIKNELSYYYGYISSSEKLKCFLHDYRTVTYTSFTVRSSRSYIKKRALNALKSVRNENGELGIDVNVTDDIRSRNIANAVTNSIKCNDTAVANLKAMRKKTDSFDGASSDEGQNVFDDDSILTGPLRWEFILGKPPIPFTGIPFFIIGNTQYQCYYATADIRTQRRKEKIAKILKENPGVKTRTRRSMKRDCKAVMCIKSIVTFPEFSVIEKLQGVKSKKGCRRLKACTLENLRDEVNKGGPLGHPAFWVHIPLPEAHSTHDVIGSAEEITDQGNMEEITHILELAAQYGGQLEMSSENAENITHL